MKQIIGIIVLGYFTNLSSTSASVKNHTCLSDTVGICILTNVVYNRNHDTSHIFPKNYTHFRIGSDIWWFGVDSLVTEFDSDLYRALGDPNTLEIVNVQMETLHIPCELLFGNFADNHLEAFSIEPGNTEPKLTYLDLGRNSISNLTNITGLVNLEILFLYFNDIRILETSIFQNLNKLKFLNLNNNKIDQIVSDHLPQSLTYLGFFGNGLKTLDFSSLRLASLEELNIQGNMLQSINASALLIAMPKLKLVRLDRNELSWDSLLVVIETLQRHNVSFRREADSKSCYHDEEMIEGACVKWPKLEKFLKHT